MSASVDSSAARSTASPASHSRTLTLLAILGVFGLGAAAGLVVAQLIILLGNAPMPDAWRGAWLRVESFELAVGASAAVGIASVLRVLRRRGSLLSRRVSIVAFMLGVPTQILLKDLAIALWNHLHGY